jgi:L-alanine-DL-glutamate epimerase-like enolase superfamily enzyme
MKSIPLNQSRRDFLRLALTLPFGASLFGLRAAAAPFVDRVKITAIKAMQLDFMFGGCLIKIETDAGLVGYGEAGASGPMARAYLKHMTEGKYPGADKMKNGPSGLIGSDPLAIERLFYRMTSLQHPFMGHYGILSGIDTALWDLAGKITGQPVYKLLGGPFRDGCAMYSHCDFLRDMHDPVSCRDWVQEMKEEPEGFDFFKFNIDQAFDVDKPYHPTVTSEELRKFRRGLANLRDAVGDAFELGVACHGEFDTPSGIAICKASEPFDVSFVEDTLDVRYSDGWKMQRQESPVPILTGEKLGPLREFKPFMDELAVDIIHPDIAYAGGITGVSKIADYAAITRIPVALHNRGSLVRTYASAHLSMAIQNFYRSESSLGRPGRVIEQMSNSIPPAVKDGILRVPDTPGLGLDLDEDFMRSRLVEGEPWWD